MSSVRPASVGDETLLPTASVPSVSGDDPATLSLLAETVSVARRTVAGRKFRVSARTITEEEVVETQVDQQAVEINRVTINRFVDTMPETRVDGDTTILSIVEERLVVVKRLFVVEEVHLTRHKRSNTQRISVPLRRQHALIEIFDPEGALVQTP